MNYTDIKQYDVANGSGVRVSLSVSGCRHQCKGCINEDSWDFHYGKPFTQAIIDEIIQYIAPSYVKGLTILGGEPMEPSNQVGLLPLARRFKETYPDKTIWIYTGYLFDKEILEQMYDKYPETRELLSLVDVIVDGRYVEELKSIDKRFKGSSNQRIILVKETIQKGDLVILDEKLYNDW